MNTLPEIPPPSRHIGSGLYSSGRKDIKLLNQYDPDQYWLEFGHGFVFANKISWESFLPFQLTFSGFAKPNVHELANQEFGASSDYKRLPKLVPPQHNVAQLYLPFAEYRMISGHCIDAYILRDFPSFDRDPDGNVYSVLSDIDVELCEETMRWCLENFIGRFAIKGSKVILENREDYLIAKLKF